MFLKEIKALTLYFIKFNEDRSILLKKYLKDCKVSRSNQGAIIMIIYDESTFFANNKH